MFFGGSKTRAFRSSRVQPYPTGRLTPRFRRDSAEPDDRFEASGGLIDMRTTSFEQFFENVCKAGDEEGRPSGIHAGNLVQEIVAALKSGDKRQQGAVLAFVFAHPADAQRVAQSAEIAALAAVDEQLAAQVKAILAMKKPAV